MDSRIVTKRKNNIEHLKNEKVSSHQVSMTCGFTAIRISVYYSADFFSSVDRELYFIEQ